MKPALASLLCVLSLPCYPSEEGQLLWESDNERQALSKFKPGQIFLFPRAPMGGKAIENPVRIGIVDSGVARKHPQLDGYLEDARDFTGEGLEDELGHGTSVALITLFGTGAEKPPSVLLSAKVVRRNGKIRKNEAIEGIKWAVDRGAKVINLSLGFEGSRNEHEDLCALVASSPDIMFVAAAGNSGPDTQVFPAACNVDNILPIGATGNDGKPAGYSGAGAVYAQGSWAFLPEWSYYYQLGQIQASNKDFVQARTAFQKSIDIEENAASHYQIGVLDLSEDKPSAAIGRFENSIEIDPAMPEAHEMLGAALFVKGNFQLAEKSLRNAIDLYPDHADFQYQRARAHFNLGQTLRSLNRNKEAHIQFLETKRLVPAYPRIDQMLRLVP